MFWKINKNEISENQRKNEIKNNVKFREILIENKIKQKKIYFNYLK